MQQRPMTIEEIAERANVSKATVSLVINGRPGPSASTVEHVRKVMKESKYVPSARAQRFAARKSKSIALIVLPYPQVFRDPHHGDALDAVHEILRGEGYSLLLDTSREEFITEQLHLNMLRSGQVDGLLLLEPTLDQPYLKELAEEKAPVVVINSDGSSLGLDYVRTDDIAIGRVGTEYLHQLGHKEIGFVAASKFHASARDRLQGFEQTAEQKGIPSNKRHIFHGEFDTSFYSGQQACETILKDHPNTTAIFCSNDTMAQGVLDTARKNGRKVPEDLSVLGVDDNPTASYSTPRLTTIRQPSHEVAKQATNVLLTRLNKPEEYKPIAAELEPTLIVRDSCTSPGK